MSKELFTPEDIDILQAAQAVKVINGESYVKWSVAMTYFTIGVLTGDVTKVAAQLLALDTAVQNVEDRVKNASEEE